VVGEKVRAKGLAPEEEYVDQGDTSGKPLVPQALQGTQIIGPVPGDGSWQQREHSGYAVSDFQLDWPQRTATCPQGVASLKWIQRDDEHNEPLEVIRFPVKVCRDSQVREPCTPGARGPELMLHAQLVHQALVQRRAEQFTPAFLERYNRRAGVEATISQAVRGSRLRRTPSVGERKTHLHHLAIAAGINLIRIQAHLQAQADHRPTRTPRPRSAFARLQERQEACCV
jgi:transposase